MVPHVRGTDGTTPAVCDGPGDLIHWNILGVGEIIGRAVKGATSTDRQYYVKDHLGSIRVTVNEGGSVDHQSDYYPFGLEMPLRVTTTDAPRERYTGHEIEELGSNTTWYYAGARMYDPVVARWMTTDPLAEKFPGLSPYNYVANNPLAFIDSDGREIVPVGTKTEQLLVRRYISRLRQSKAGRALYDQLHSRKEKIFVSISQAESTSLRGNTNIKPKGTDDGFVVTEVLIELNPDNIAGSMVVTQEGNLGHELKHASDAVLITDQYVEELQAAQEMSPEERRESPQEERAEVVRSLIEKQVALAKVRLRPMAPVPVDVDQEEEK